MRTVPFLRTVRLIRVKKERLQLQACIKVAQAAAACAKTILRDKEPGDDGPSHPTIAAHQRMEIR
jgi:hypothetical protein